MTAFSVIIPTYNRLSLLQRAIASILAQSHPVDEIIIIDDGSTDTTAEWVQNLDDPRIQYLYQSNAGPAAARNLGIQKAKGEWIALLDSDDEWLPNKIKVQLEFLQKNSDYQVCQCEEIWLKNGERINPHKKHQKHSGWIFKECLPLCIVSPSAAVFSKKLFLEVGGFDENLPVCEDYDLWLRMALRSPIMTLPEPQIVKYGGHADQLSKRHWGMDRFRVQSLEKILQQEKLTSKQKTWLLEELIHKLKILSQGFKKRNPLAPNPYEEKWKNYHANRSCDR